MGAKMPVVAFCALAGMICSVSLDCRHLVPGMAAIRSYGRVPCSVRFLDVPYIYHPTGRCSFGATTNRIACIRHPSSTVSSLRLSKNGFSTLFATYEGHHFLMKSKTRPRRGSRTVWRAISFLVTGRDANRSV